MNDVQRCLKLLLLILSSVLSSSCERKPRPIVVVEDEPTVTSLINTFVDGEGISKGISFAEVVEASSGNQIIPFDSNDPVDTLVLQELESAIEQVIELFNSEDSPVKGKRRIDDLSNPLDSEINKILAAAPGFKCDYARKLDGNILRRGYPDLRLFHEDSGRVIYLDPRLVRQSTLDASLNTFFYNPGSAFGKIHEDANHLLLGIEHDGNTGEWKFSDWHIIDLYKFRIRLKAEFQAPNKDVYLPEYLIKQSND